MASDHCEAEVLILCEVIECTPTPKVQPTSVAIQIETWSEQDTTMSEANCHFKLVDKVCHRRPKQQLFRMLNKLIIAPSYDGSRCRH